MIEASGNTSVTVFEPADQPVQRKAAIAVEQPDTVVSFVGNETRNPVNWSKVGKFSEAEIHTRL